MPTIHGQSIQHHALVALGQRRKEEATAEALHADQRARARHGRLVALLADIYGADWAELEPQLGAFGDRVTVDEITFSLWRGDLGIERLEQTQLEAAMMNPHSGERERALVFTLADVGELVARVKRLS